MRTSVLAGQGMAALVLTAIIAVPLPGNAFEFVVRTTSDTNDGLCTPESNPIQMTCSLREAIIKANEYPGKDTIQIPAGTYYLTISGPGENEAATGDLDVLEDLDILGAGSTKTRILGQINDRIFDSRSPVGAPPNPLLQLFDLTMSDSKGGVNSFYGNVYLWRVVVEDCTNPGVNTGNGTALIADSVIRRISSTAGSPVMVVSGNLLIIRSTISDNTVDGTGGNRGAISCQFSTASLVNSTITGNTVMNTLNGPGGFHGVDCTTTIDSCTVVGNSPNEIGVDLGLPGTTTIRNTYIWGSCSPGSSDHLTSEGGNVADPASCGLSHASDQPSPSSLLVMPLGYFGGYTPVMLPFGIGSHPIVDNPGADGNCQSVDQRSIGRPQDGGDPPIACDTGAVERTPTDYTHYWGDGFETGDTGNWDITVPPAPGNS